MKQKKKQQGFTLIELMAVFTILAMLATLAVPAVAGTIERARAGTNQSNRAMLQRAIRQFFVETGEWPTWPAPAGTPPVSAGLTLGIPNALVTGGYIQSVPVILGMPGGTAWTLQFRNPNAADWVAWVHDSNLHRNARIRVLLPATAPGHATDPPE
jgi:prepilin-type N-terminal cleavage/methylation domain-containing protein